MSSRLSLASAIIFGLVTDPVGAQQEVFTLSPPAPEIIAQDAGDVVDPSELVAVVPDAATADALTALAAAAGYILLERVVLSRLGLVMLTFELPKGVTAAEAIAALESMTPATTVGVNHAYRSGQVSRDGDPRSYAGALIQWPERGCLAKRPVGIIDGAIFPTAEALAHTDLTVRSFVEPGGATRHGTAVAELLVGPGRLGNVRAFHAVAVEERDDGVPAAAGVDVMLRAMDWLSEEGVELVNISLAGPYNKILDRGMQAAASQGMIFVAAAGNDGRAAPPRYPAAFESTIAVTAVDGALRAYRGAPEGAHIDLAAPGVDIFVKADGAGRYMTGTSLAAPFVTAAIAALWDEGTDVEVVLRLLKDESRDLGRLGHDPLFGNGLLQTGTMCR